MFIRPCIGRVTSHFQKNRLDPVSQKFFRDHNGVDIAKTGLVPILAAADGTVSLVRKDKTFGTYGNVIMIVHTIAGRIYETVYAHLSTMAVREGQTVKAGTPIGAMGSTGNSTGQHLHFEVHVGRWNNQYTNAVNPLMWIKGETTPPQMGDFGPRVGELQADLNRLGANLKVDNSFGPATYTAVKSFQRLHKLAIDGLAGPATRKVMDAEIAKVIKASKPVAPKGKTLHLPKTASAWRVYPTNKTPVAANALPTRLNPKKFGGLTYTIIGNPQKDVYTIKTAQLGTVNIYAGPGTGAVIK